MVSDSCSFREGTGLPGFSNAALDYALPYAGCTVGTKHRQRPLPMSLYALLLRIKLFMDSSLKL